ncbi:hemolysin family protein [Blastopirellula sp. JC732]|uniref:Hemolysin family protein n=1 Tax=Blastopirellula sediminis TaxID=2894196 RepID=A0A9X1SHV2_9BACT|nr:hemolysin family protein [Blastopirellula sediminis]MCC9605833.1 hemolysin family protein [Blastopirellula sediminis]MCC9630868.1 hemolysin family protein [Blastopirellula sediminis]
MLTLFLYILGFIFLSGVAALVDAAVLSVSRSEVEEMVMKKLPGAVALQGVKNRITRAVVVVVIVTNTINILGPILAGNKAIELYGETVIGVVTAILTFGTIIFSEIIPKSLGTHYAPLISRISAPPILALIYVMYPIVLPLDWLSRQLQQGERPVGTEAQIRSLAALGRTAGHIDSDEVRLVHRAFLLNDKSAADIMTPLKDVAAVRQEATVREAAKQVLEHTHSRYPVFGNSVNDVIGMVISHDILGELTEGQDQAPIERLVRPALVINAEMHCDDLLKEFRAQRIHLAIVQQAKKTVGLVTLEDVLEELVGEIGDEKEA